MAIETHPSIIQDKELMKEALDNLSKKELIEEVEFLKKQRDALTQEIQVTHGRIRGLEHKFNEMQLNVEAIITKEIE